MISPLVEQYRRQGAPEDQGVLIALLRQVQQELGGSIPMGVVQQLARELEIRESLLLALIRRIPSLRLSGSHLLEICAGENCSKHSALAQAAQKLEGVTVKFVPCMRLCGKGPNVRLDGRLYHKMDPKQLQDLINIPDSSGRR